MSASDQQTYLGLFSWSIWKWKDRKERGKDRDRI